MKKLIIAGLALFASLAAAPQSQARLNYPWCIHGDTRGTECIFKNREQCANDGRNRGFGGQCAPNPYYNPNLPSVIEEPRTAKSPNTELEPASGQKPATADKPRKRIRN